MSAQADYRTFVDEVRRTDRFGSREFFSRLALVAAGCIAGWYWLNLDVVPYWFAAYYGTVLFEKFLFVQFPDASSRRFFAALVAVSATVSVIYVSLPVYLWFRPEPVLEFAALVLLVAGCLNIYQLRSRVWPVAVAYFLPIGAAFFVMAAAYWAGPHGGAQFWAALVLAGLISGYFALSLTEAHRANRRMLNTQAHLIRAQKIAALETLAAGISHDFSRMLGVIQRNLERLQTHPKVSERKVCIHDALAAARSGSDLCAQLALYARRGTARRSTVDPIRVVDDVRTMARHVLPATVRLETETPSTMTPVFVDESALQAVLLNLIAHARDAVDGKGTISLETYLRSAARGIGHPGPDHRAVVFEVGNSGAGSPPEMPPLGIPEACFGDDGRGLALATARDFAEDAGGEFRIEPNPGRGMRVLLTLPT